MKTTTPPKAPEHDLDREVRRLLDLHRRQWQELEFEAGVSYSWMCKYARGAITNPGYATLKRLYKLLHDRPVAPPPAPRRRRRATRRRTPTAAPPKTLALVGQPA